MGGSAPALPQRLDRPKRLFLDEGPRGRWRRAATLALPTGRHVLALRQGASNRKLPSLCSPKLERNCGSNRASPPTGSAQLGCAFGLKGGGL